MPHSQIDQVYGPQFNAAYPCRFVSETYPRPDLQCYYDINNQESPSCVHLGWKAQLPPSTPSYMCFDKAGTLSSGAYVAGSPSCSACGIL